MTLAQDPNIHLQEQQVDFAKGSLQEAAGQFDFRLDSNLSRNLFRTPLTETNRLRIDSRSNAYLDPRATSVTDETNYRLGLNKQFRFGPTISPGVEVSRFTDNQDQKRAVNRASVNFALNVPLLKGLGRAATDAIERAARVTHEAAVLDLQHVIATRIVNVVAAYWNCLAAQMQSEILRASETRAAQLVERVKDLVRGQEIPASEIKQAQADLSEKSAARIAGEQRFFQARQNLGLALGLTSGQLATPPIPVDVFPQPATNAAVPRFPSQPIIERSLNRRTDYQSALKAQQAAEILLAAGRNNLKPQLDFNLEVGYAGLDEGSQFRRLYGSLDYKNLSGLNLIGALHLEWPIANNAARGLLMQREASKQQALIRTRDLARTIGSGILVAFSELDLTMEELKKAAEAASYYREAVENEKEKLRIGTSTIIDVITTGDRLSNALLNEISVQSRYAVALVRLRFETGLLVPVADTQNITLDRADLITIPQLDLLQPVPINP